MGDNNIKIPALEPATAMIAANSTRGTEKSPRGEKWKQGSKSDGQLSLPGVQEVVQEPHWPDGPQPQALSQADHLLG